MKRIRHLNILPPTLLLALSALFSRFLGIYRDHLLAKSFGASAGTGIYNLDAYYAAFRIPDVLYNLLIFGAISAAFIPIFTQYKKENKMQDAWAFASSMLHLMFLGVLGISVILYALAPQLTNLVAGGLGPVEFAQTTKLMRILLLSPILMSITAVLISLQDSFKTFFFRSLGPLFYNLGIIFGVIYWGAEFGTTGVTWGVILGVALQLLLQIPAMFKIGYKHEWVLGTKRKDVREAFKLLVPRVLGLSLNQLTLIINTLIASFLATGSITVFYLADNLQAVPLGIIAISFAITSFATLSELASEPSTEKFAKEIQRVMQQVLFLIIPATLGILILRDEIIDVILVAGKFTATDARLTSGVMAFLLISLFAQSLIPLLARGFYAYHDTKTPLITGALGAMVSIGGSIFLAIAMGYGIVGIAMAFSIGTILNFVLLYLFMVLKVKRDLLDWKHISKMITCSLIMSFGVIYAKGLMDYPVSIIDKIISLSVLAAIGVVIYFATAKIAKIPELNMLKKN